MMNYNKQKNSRSLFVTESKSCSVLGIRNLDLVSPALACSRVVIDLRGRFISGRVFAVPTQVHAVRRQLECRAGHSAVVATPPSECD